MREKIKALTQQVDEFKVESKELLETFRLRFLSKKGEINQLFNDFKTVLPEDRKEIGMLINQLKKKAQEKFEQSSTSFSQGATKSHQHEDLTKPVNQQEIGARHPISIVRNEISEIFSRIGFTVAEGPEIENDWHNFSALNFPEEHPARDMQDTFFVNKNPDIALRTHTSSVQVRVMESEKPPIRVIAPGRVFRNEAISARAHCIFHQIEGLYIDKKVSFVDLKQTLFYFAKSYFGEGTKIRFRPSYFPFTEPSAEMDVSCNICGQKGCNVCKYTGWLEILGCGMVDPNVLKSSGLDPDKYSGFAFGMGIERIAMLKYNINDLRLYFENDLRFLKQFKSVM
ncbi:MAG: phenylalanine--tRNA ligase subunit alpha [Bacteroidetes bacterium]|nr:MAG: phenylalanine--tRNA ligase subunit alpha [Bacteroidota bacterium]